MVYRLRKPARNISRFLQIDDGKEAAYYHWRKNFFPLIQNFSFTPAL